MTALSNWDVANTFNQSLQIQSPETLIQRAIKSAQTGIRTEFYDGLFEITGVPGFDLCREIEGTWNINDVMDRNGIFNDVSYDSITFNKFFVQEILYIFSILAIKNVCIIPNKVLLDAIDSLITHEWVNETFRPKPGRLDLSVESKFKWKPLAHQLPFFNLYDSRFPKLGLKGCYLAGGVGSGKTFMSCFIMEAANVDKVFIFCPKKSVFDVWVKSIGSEKYSFFNEPPKTWNVISSNHKYVEEECKYFVFNFESTGKMLDIVSSFVEQGLKIGFIIDECQYCTNTGANLTANILNAITISKSEDIIFASATPIKALGKDMIPALRALDRNFTPECEKRFNKFFISGNDNRAIDMLEKRFSYMSYVITRENYMTLPKPKSINHFIDLDPERAHRYLVETVTNEMKEYAEKTYNALMNNPEEYLKPYHDQLVKYKSNLIDKADIKRFERYLSFVNQLRAANSFSEKNKLKSYCNAIDKTYIAPTIEVYDTIDGLRTLNKYKTIDARNEFLKLAKLNRGAKASILGMASQIFHDRRRECFNDITQQDLLLELILSSKGKVILYSSYVDVCEKTALFLKENGIKCVEVHGQVVLDKKGCRLEDHLLEFRENEEVRAVISTFNSLADSIHLTEACTIIFLNQPYRSYWKIQATGRVDRLDQIFQVFEFNLLLNTADQLNLSTRADAILKWSEKQVKQIMGLIKTDSTYLQEIVV